MTNPEDRIGRWQHRRITCMQCRDDSLHRRPIDGSATWECGSYADNGDWHATVHAPNEAARVVREREQPTNGVSLDDVAAVCEPLAVRQASERETAAQPGGASAEPASVWWRAGWRELPNRYNEHAQYTCRDDDIAHAIGTVFWAARDGAGWRAATDDEREHYGADVNAAMARAEQLAGKAASEPVGAGRGALAKLYADAGEVTPEEAREILGRFNASHFDNATEHARYSIPCDPKRDDDVRLGAFIEQAATARARLAEVEAERDARENTIRVGRQQLAEIRDERDTAIARAEAAEHERDQLRAAHRECERERDEGKRTIARLAARINGLLDRIRCAHVALDGEAPAVPAPEQRAVLPGWTWEGNHATHPSGARIYSYEDIWAWYRPAAVETIKRSECKPTPAIAAAYALGYTLHSLIGPGMEWRSPDGMAGGSHPTGDGAAMQALEHAAQGKGTTP